MVSLLPAALRRILQGMPAMALAFSGGLDSRFLCHAARLCGCRLLAVHARGPHMPPAESGFARRWAEARGIEYAEIVHDPLREPDVAQNNRNRCYACKKLLLQSIRNLPRLKDFPVLCDGGNADDGRAFRPGMRAVREAGILSPLAMAGMGKEDIRRCARLTGMDFPGQQARPCLLTRLAYGIRPDADALAAIAAAEEEIGALTKANFRLRLLPEPQLHLAAPQDEILPELNRILRRHGFGEAKIAVVPDLSGFFDRQKTCAANSGLLIQ